MSGRTIFVLATDISDQFFRRPVKGIYTETQLFRGLPSIYRKRYFTPMTNEQWQIVPEIREKICFEQHALHQSPGTIFPNLILF